MSTDLLVVTGSRSHRLAVRQAMHAALEFVWILQISVALSDQKYAIAAQVHWRKSVSYHVFHDGSKSPC